MPSACLAAEIVMGVTIFDKVIFANYPKMWPDCTQGKKKHRLTKTLQMT